ncbi:unnamed protein product [Rangifer tarandus platyrhynchus]|uniref:Uncharacterized protein n=1 Tax=Rangifer tarandus platyrhynchus TaxID=3082113 RepID=A0AC59ZAY3_RANTA
MGAGRERLRARLFTPGTWVTGSPEFTAVVTCYRHTMALLKFGPGHSQGVHRAEPRSGSGMDSVPAAGNAALGCQRLEDCLG